MSQNFWLAVSIFILWGTTIFIAFTTEAQIESLQNEINQLEELSK